MTQKKMTTARELYARLHQLNIEVEELPSFAKAKKDKFLEILQHCPPWSYWYEMPWKNSLAIFLMISGLDHLVIKASKDENPQEALFKIFDANPDPINDDDLSDEEKAVYLSLFMCIHHQIRSLSIFSLTLSQLVEKAKTNDEALFNAVLVDRSVISCPTVAKRIQIAQLCGDEAFLNRLSKAITRTIPRRPETKYDDLRFMLEAIEDMKELSGLTVKEKYQLFAEDLELFDTENKKDSFEAFKKLLRRKELNKGT